MNTILLIIASGVLGYELVYSDLSYQVKRLLGLHKIIPLVQLLSAWKVHKQVLGKWLLFPPVLALSLTVFFLAGLHRFLFGLLQCPYCTSFWVGVFASLFFQIAIPFAIVNGLCAMGVTALYNLIRTKSI